MWSDTKKSIGETTTLCVPGLMFILNNQSIIWRHQRTYKHLTKSYSGNAFAAYSQQSYSLNTLRHFFHNFESWGFLTYFEFWHSKYGTIIVVLYWNMLVHRIIFTALQPWHNFNEGVIHNWNVKDTAWPSHSPDHSLLAFFFWQNYRYYLLLNLFIVWEFTSDMWVHKCYPKISKKKKLNVISEQDRNQNLL